jgi:hypothetical protein
MTVHDQHPDIELASPVYFCNCGTYYEYPVKRTNADTIMEIDFRFDLAQDESSGILVYEVRRKSDIRSDHQSSIDTLYAKVTEEALKMIRLLVTWKVKHSWEPKVKIMLVECDDKLVLNEDKLAQLCNRVNDIYSVCHPCESTWLICDNTTLRATHKIVRKQGFESKISIFKGFKGLNNIRSRWIDSERQVLSEMIVDFVLIYIASLAIQSVIDVIIDNQCTNIELTSPAYFIKGAKCHIQFPQRVNSRSMMKASFITSIDRDMFGGVLLYHLRRKENTQTDIQLLVTWGYNSERLYSDAWVIEHEHTLVWNKDKLKRLHDVYSSQRNVYLDIRYWLLDDNTNLETTYEALHGCFEMKVIISEEKRQYLSTEPLWIDSNR